jgi:hypothetical protein
MTSPKQLVLYIEEISPGGGLDTRMFVHYNAITHHFSLYLTRDDPSKKKKIFGEHVLHASFTGMITILKNIFGNSSVMNFRLYIMQTTSEKKFSTLHSKMRFNDELFGYTNYKFIWSQIEDLLVMMSNLIGIE